MHVPDGFLDAPTSLATGVVAVGAVAVALRGSRRELGGVAQASGGAERLAPLAGLVAAFVFAVQMLNFPVAAGTSGHLLGGALAAILVGPYTAVLCLAVVLLMQAVLFADGGLTALGTNVTLMGVVTALCAYATFRGLLLVLPRRRSAVTGATFVAALVSVPASALVFTGLYAVGGTADVSLGKVLAAMLGVHVLIGIGEAVITTLTVGAVLSVRPDLVYGARDRLPVLTLRTATPTAPRAPGDAGEQPAPEVGPGDRSEDRPEDQPGGRAAGKPAGDAVPVAARATPRRLWLAGVLAALVCAGLVSFYASASPDGLEKVAGDHGIDEEVTEHGLADSPLADYGIEDLSDERLSVGLAGTLGVGVTLAVGSGVFVLVRRRNRAESTAEPATGPTAEPTAEPRTR